MDRSQYLAQAVQNMGQPLGAQEPQGLSLQQMAQVVQQRDAWRAENPGQSYAMHGLKQFGQNAMQAPGDALAGLQGLGRLFGGR